MNQSFSDWIAREVMSCKYALLAALERLDEMRYVERAELQEEYMTKIGVHEEKVLEIELEESLMEEKVQMVQAAVNKREKVNMEEIDAAIDVERQKILSKMKQSSGGHSKREKLNEEDKEELKNLYKEIVEKYHPEVHTDITENQKYLFEKAVEAYQEQSLEQMRLVYDMINSQESSLALEFEIVVRMESGKEKKLSAKEIAQKLVVDYSLAGELFPYFQRLETDEVLLSSKEKYVEKENEVLMEIETLQQQFPFTTKETLRNPEKLNEYLEDLKIRMHASEQRIKELDQEIIKLVGEQPDV